MKPAPPEDPVASARIVSPEDASSDPGDQALIRISLALARMAGTPLHVVKFSDGVTAMVVGDPDDTEAWQRILSNVHKNAVVGSIGPIPIKE